MTMTYEQMMKDLKRVLGYRWPHHLDRQKLDALVRGWALEYKRAQDGYDFWMDEAHRRGRFEDE